MELSKAGTFAEADLANRATINSSDCHATLCLLSNLVALDTVLLGAHHADLLMICWVCNGCASKCTSHLCLPLHILL